MSMFKCETYKDGWYNGLVCGILFFMTLIEAVAIRETYFDKDFVATIIFTVLLVFNLLWTWFYFNQTVPKE